MHLHLLPLAATGAPPACRRWLRHAGEKYAPASGSAAGRGMAITSSELAES
jgi:hypothetical protein